MTKVLKEFIEQRGNLLDDNNFKQLFLDAYGEDLMTSEVQELHEMLLDADITSLFLFRFFYRFHKITEPDRLSCKIGIGVQLSLHKKRRTDNHIQTLINLSPIPINSLQRPQQTSQK